MKNIYALISNSMQITC